MAKKESTLVNELLFWIDAAHDILSPFIATPHEWRRRALYGRNFSSYKNTVYHLKRRGLVEIIPKQGRKYLRLTKKGELEVLLAKAKMPGKRKWDGRWRVVIFDIPENNKLERNQLRDLLKKNNFCKLQNSVYINPNPLNREAISYLQETGLIKFIRILKIEEMDNDKDLRKKFHLK